MEKNKYQNYGMTYALWGSAYGYANLSKILLSSIDSSTKVLNLLANYTANITIKKSLDDKMVSNYLNAKKVSEAISPVFEWNMSDEKNENSGNSDSIKISFHKTLKNSPELGKKAEWLETLVWCYDFMMKNNFEGALFDNSYKAKEFESLLIDKKSKGDLKGFGKAKIQSAVSEFLKFIANNE
jgi:hypothetical protein